MLHVLTPSSPTRRPSAPPGRGVDAEAEGVEPPGLAPVDIGIALSARSGRRDAFDQPQVETADQLALARAIDKCCRQARIARQAGAHRPCERPHRFFGQPFADFGDRAKRSEEHTSELQSLMRTSYADI